MLSRTVTYNVVEIRDSGAVIQHYLKGKKRDVKKQVEEFKKNCKTYMTVSNNSVIVWV